MEGSKRIVQDRHYTVAIPGAQAAGVCAIQIYTPDGADSEIEVWGTGGVPGFVFEGNVTLPDAQSRVSQVGTVDAIMAIPAGGRARVGINPDIHTLTAYWDGTEGANPCGITVRLISRQRSEAVARESRVG